jgi:hypothetical protein
MHMNYLLAYPKFLRIIFTFPTPLQRWIISGYR